MVYLSSFEKHDFNLQLYESDFGLEIRSEISQKRWMFEHMCKWFLLLYIILIYIIVCGWYLYIFPFTDCKSGTYGYACIGKCGRCLNSTCDRYTGICTEGCQYGYYPPLCQESMNTCFSLIDNIYFPVTCAKSFLFTLKLPLDIVLF